MLRPLEMISKVDNYSRKLKIKLLIIIVIFVAVKSTPLILKNKTFYL